jgi:hypothetical protein
MGFRGNIRKSPFTSAKATPLQVWSGPYEFQEFEDSRISRQSAHEGDKVAGPTHLPPLPQGMSLVLISLRGGVDPRAIVRPGLIILMKNSSNPIGESNPRPSIL